MEEKQPINKKYLFLFILLVLVGTGIASVLAYRASKVDLSAIEESTFSD